MFGFVVQSPTASTGSKVILSIIPQVAMSLMCGIFGGLESSQTGVQFDNMAEQVNNYSFLTGLIMMFISFWLFLLLASYLDSVLPRTYGERKKPCFCFTICCKREPVEPEDFS